MDFQKEWEERMGQKEWRECGWKFTTHEGHQATDSILCMDQNGITTNKTAHSHSIVKPLTVKEKILNIARAIKGYNNRKQ